MITVEELIVQSLYHRLVLVTVRRSGNKPPSTDNRDSAESAQKDVETESCQPEEGHGSSERDTAAVLQRGPDESIQFTRRTQTILDTRELQLVRSSTSTECQTDFEPLWCISSIPVSGESGKLLSRVSDLPFSQGMIDLQDCEQFTVARLEDLRDPLSQSFVMVQMGGKNINGSELDCSETTLPSLGNASAMFVGNGVDWNHKLELGDGGNSKKGAIEETQHSSHIDSGIWDMVQASQVDLFNSVAGKGVEQVPSHDVNSGNSDGLAGSYRLYSYDDFPESESEMAETKCDGNVKIRKFPGERRDFAGGLVGILEPVAAVEFVVHRVESDAASIDNLKGLNAGKCVEGASSDALLVSRSQKDVAGQDEPPRFPRVENLTGIGNNIDVKINDADVVPSGKSLQSSDLSSEEDGFKADKGCSSSTQMNTDVTEGERIKPCNKSEKSHRDIVEITSVRLARSSVKRRTPGRYRYWRDSHLKSRKAKSAETSPRCSSMIDVSAGAQELSYGMSSLSVAQSTERIDRYSPVHSSALSPGSMKMHHNPVLSPSSSLKNVGRSTRGVSDSMSVSSLDWLVDNTVPNLDRGSSASYIDLYAELELTDFEKFPNWMRDLPKVLHSVPISDLCIPGSHIAVAIERDMRTDLDFSKCNYEMAEFLRKLPDLALFNNFRALMKKIWRTWMPKQCLSLYDQMVAGSRYLDMRITKYSGELYGEHGLYTRPLKAYLRDVRRFVEEHTSEVVILHFQSSDFLERADKRHLVTTLFQSFGAKMATTSASVSSLPSLKQMWAGGKQIIIFFPSADIELVCNHIFGGLVWSDDLVRLTASPKTQTVVDLIASLDTVVPGSTPRKQSITSFNKTLSVVKAVLSPDMSMVFGRFEYRSMRELVIYETAGAVSQWLDGKEGGCLNVVVLDFVGIGDVVGKVIRINADLAARFSAL